MTELLTAAQMRAIETAAIESGAVTGLELMERAGRGVVAAIFQEWPDLQAAPHKAVVLCGPGNNGGDGFVIARLLKEWGWAVDVLLYGDPEKLPPDARANYDKWCQLGAVGSVLTEFDARATLEGCDLAVDALFGTGLARPLEDLTPVLTRLKEAASRSSGPVSQNQPEPAEPRVVAVDIPSGLDADSGLQLGPAHHGAAAAAANLTVSFHRMKLGHSLADGPGLCGQTVVADIGLPQGFGLGTRADAALSELHGLTGPQGGDAVRRYVTRLVELDGVSPDLLKTTDAHKYDHGHALVVTGPMGRTGAARLAARGALRVGAGLVTLATPDEAIMECAAQVTAIMLRRCDDAGRLSDLLEDARLNALCLGPGLGVGADTRAFVASALSAKRALVLDADALTSFEDAPEELFALTQGTATVLTPHGGEFARLFPDIAAPLAASSEKGPAFSKVDATRKAAARAGCVVLLKGPDTVIADQDGMCSVHAAMHDRAAPWLATAGAGDVLAGFITGLLARGLAPFAAAEAAAWLHVEAARAFGPGLIAEDLPEVLPDLFRALSGDQD